ncbi:unnamed protein product [Schistocephalus solidus]|uniref:C2H2-type domain-containing protein n=1 Tax=Schistocephalus solidus TaxID=70667 RepID=A0A183SMW2_SCHSO|nr:unnamed protein product [Schistocephalus solidus]
MLVTKVFSNADGWTDHCHVISQMRLRLQPRRRPQGKKPPVLGRTRRQHQDWFDDNDADISNLLPENNGLHKTYMDLRIDATKAAFFRCRRLVQQRLWEMQDAWMIRKAEEIQGFNSRIGLVGHLRIHRTEVGEPVPVAPTYRRRVRLHCPNCSRTFTHHMGLVGYVRLHDNLG